MHLVIATLTLTFLGSFLAQVNALVLRHTVDELSLLVENNNRFKEGISLLLTISAILLLKELIYAAIQYGHKYYGEKLKIYISCDLA